MLMFRSLSSSILALNYFPSLFLGHRGLCTSVVPFPHRKLGSVNKRLQSIKAQEGKTTFLGLRISFQTLSI